MTFDKNILLINFMNTKNKTKTPRILYQIHFH